MNRKKMCWPLVVPVIAGGLLMCAVPTHAGQWLYKIEATNGKLSFPVQSVHTYNEPWNGTGAAPEETFPWLMPLDNGERPIGETNYKVGGDTYRTRPSNGANGMWTVDGAATPHSTTTHAESSAEKLKIICTWKAAAYNWDTGEWIPDGSKPTDKALRLTIGSEVWAASSVNAPWNDRETGPQPPPADGDVTVEVQGLGSSASTLLTGGDVINNGSWQVLSKGASQTAGKTFVLPVPASVNGKYEVIFEVPGIKAKGIITTGSGMGHGYTVVNAGYDIKNINTLNVYITGNDPTYKKVATYADLPDSTNPLTPGKDLSKINTSATPLNGADSGPWAVMCEPDASNGKMTAHRAAEWNEYPDCTGWYGGGYWRASTPGLLSPTYDWSVSGGTPTEHFQATLEEGLPTISAAAGLLGQGWGGTTKDGVFLDADPRGDSLNGMQSKVTLNAIDQEGYMGADDYTIKWHAVDEDWQQKNTTVLTPTVLNLGPITTNGNGFSYPHQSEVDVNYRQGAFVASGVIGIGAIAFSVAAPEATVIANIIRIVGGATGITANFIVAPEPPPATQVSANFSDLKNDLLNGGDADVTGVVDIFVQESRTEQEFIIDVSNATNSQDCTFWGDGHLSVKLKVTFKRQAENWDSDFYTGDGYAGRKDTTYTHEVEAIKERTWTYDNRWPGGQ